MSDAELTSYLLAKYPDQVPKTFKVSPLPDTITSGLLDLLQRAKRQLESPRQPMPRVTHTGNGGSSSCTPLSSSTIPSSMDSAEESNTAYWDALPSPFGSAITVSPHEAMINWFREHVVPPSTAWLRPSLPPTDPTLGRTSTARLHSFYSAS